MSKSIYKLCLVQGYTEAYYQLSEEAKKDLWDEVGKAVAASGEETYGPFYDCKWSSYKYEFWFMIKYPNIESVFSDTHGVQKAGLFRYMICETILGIEAEDINRILGIADEENH